MISLSDSREHNVCKSRTEGLADVNKNVRANGCSLIFVTSHCINQSQWKGRFVLGDCLFNFKDAFEWQIRTMMESMQSLQLKLILCIVARVPLVEAHSILMLTMRKTKSPIATFFISLKFGLFNQLWSLSTPSGIDYLDERVIKVFGKHEDVVCVGIFPWMQSTFVQ